MCVWSGSWACEKSTVEAKAYLPLLCKSEFWLPANYLCFEGNVWITECPFPLTVTSTVMRGGVCLSSAVVSQAICPLAEEAWGTACVPQPRVTLAGVQLPPYKAFPVLATRAALSAKSNNTMLLPFTMCNHEENYKKEM